MTATVIADTSRVALHGFVHDHIADGSTVYTDGAEGYKGVGAGHDLDHAAVRHSVGEYVRGEVHTNGMESFWSMLKRGYYGTYHKMSFKHLRRYVAEFAARHNVRDLDTFHQMGRPSERHGRKTAHVPGFDRRRACVRPGPRNPRMGPELRVKLPHFCAELRARKPGAMVSFLISEKESSCPAGFPCPFPATDSLLLPLSTRWPG